MSIFGSAGKFVEDTVSGASDAISSGVGSITNSVDQIVDSGGDFFRAVGRGDLSGAGNDLLSMGWETTNLMLGGAPNLAADAVKRALMPDIPPPEYSDRKVMARSASMPRRIVYGTCRVGGVVRYIESTGDDAQTMHVILIFAAHSCVDIERVYFNDELAFIGTAAQGKYAGKAAMIYETGKQSGANDSIVASTPSGWTSEHKLLGQTYAYFKLDYDNDVYQGLPNIDAVVKGNDTIYDPRTGASGYSDNQALIVRDWLTKDYGYNEQNINEASFIKGADICDEQMAAAIGTEKRYTCNGTLSITDKPSSGLETINGAGASGCAYYQGELYYIAGAYESPESVAYTERDFFGGIQIVPMISAADRLNYITGNFIDPMNNYEQNDFVPVVVDQYIVEDKQELKTDAKFPFANTQTKARRLAKLYMEQSRYGTTLSGKMSFRALSKKYGDRIKVSIERLGWTDRVFRIVSAELGIDGVDVVLQEDSSLVWSWEAGDALVVDAPPALNIPDGSYVTTPTGITATESLYIANDKTTVRSRITLTWDGSTTARNYEVESRFEAGQFLTVSDYLSAPTVTIDDAQVGDWTFRVCAINNLGFKSEWANYDFASLGKTAPPDDVFGFEGDVNPFNIEFKWNPVADIDLQGYELRLGSDWKSGTVIQSIKATRWQWELRPTGQEKVWIKALDTSGNYSANATPVEFEIDTPSMVTPLTAQVIDNNVLLRWYQPNASFSIDYYEIRRGDTIENSESRSSVKGTFSTQFEELAGDFRYWVRAVDVNGNTGPWADVLAQVNAPPDYSLLADQYLEFREYISLDSTTVTLDSTTIKLDTNDIQVGTTTNLFARRNPKGSPSPFSLVGPVSLTETVAQHFDALSGTTVNDKQAGNGFPYFAQPTLASGSHVQTIDYGGLVGTTRISLTPDVEILDGSPTVEYKIAWSDDNVTFEEVTGVEVVARDFRYVRITINVAATAQNDLLSINSVNVKLNVKTRTDQGKGTSLSTDSGGTFVPFNVPFVDVISITPSVNTNQDYTIVYDFIDAPNPAGFSVLLYNAAGNRVSGDFSWSARGV